MANTEVKVNLEALDSALQTYNTEIEKIRDAVQAVDLEINELRTSGWKTNGADEFFNNYDSSWKREFDDHIAYLEHLRDCLKTAQGEYRDAYENISGLR